MDEVPQKDDIFMEDGKKSKVRKKHNGTGVKIISVILAVALLTTMFAFANTNYRNIFFSLFSGETQETFENVPSSEEKSAIPSDVIELEIDQSMPDYSQGDANIPLGEIAFDIDSAYLDTGESSRLKYTKVPEEADISDLKWVSSDPSVLAVSNMGTITGISEGKSTVSIYSLKYNVKTSCTIYVRQSEVEEPEEIPPSSDDETGLFKPPEGDDDGDISNDISHTASVNSPSYSSQVQSQVSSQAPSEEPSVAPSITVSEVFSNVSSVITSSEVSEILSSGENSSATSSEEASSNISSNTSNPEQIAQLANKLIKVKHNNGTYVAVTVFDYLVFNTSGEMDARYSDESVKAQIVCIYTYYIIYNMSKGASYASMERDRVFKFNDDGTVDFSKPKYHWPERNGSWERLQRLCLEVIGQAVMYNGKGACATFSHANRGMSQASSPYWGSEKIPYLTIVDSPWDELAEGWERIRTIDKDTVYDKLSELVGEENLTMEPQYWFYELARDVPDEGYIDYITIGAKTVSGYKLRSKFSFRSNCIFAEYDAENEIFTFTVYGNGHGIGYSQEGGEGMAKAGYKWDEILMHYFPGTDITYKEPVFYEG